jgi:hypothetical protein
VIKKVHINMCPILDGYGVTLRVIGELNFGVHLSIIKEKKKEEQIKAIPVIGRGGA